MIGPVPGPFQGGIRMMRFAISLLLLCLLSTGAIADTPAQSVWMAIRALDRAIVTKDRPALAGLLTDDFVGAIPNGMAFDKKAYIEHHCRPGMGLQALEGQDIEKATIRIFGDAAIVNRVVHARRVEASGAAIEYDVRRIEVLIRADGVWRVASGQGTQIVPPPMQERP